MHNTKEAIRITISMEVNEAEVVEVMLKSYPHSLLEFSVNHSYRLKCQVRQNFENLCGPIHTLRDPSYALIKEAQTLKLLDMDRELNTASPRNYTKH